MKNQQEMIQNLLSIGFSQKEASVYLALMELGRGGVSKISIKAGINRTTGYDILSSLVNKQVVSVSGKEPKQEYMIEPPTNIIKYLENQRSQIDEKIKKSTDIALELNSIYTKESRPKIRFYEGEDGLISVYEDTLTSSETIMAYATVDEMHDALPKYFSDYYKRRSEKNIFIKAIIPKTDIGDERAKNDIEEKRETMFVPADKYYFSPEINIYDNKVMIASWREKLGIIIESAEIADAMKKIYSLAWAGANGLEK